MVVNDPDDGIQVLTQRYIVSQSGEFGFTGTFEGIVTDRRGDMLFASDFWLGLVHPLSTSDLLPVHEPLEVRTGPEGLSVIPSDSLLLVSHKRFYFTVIALPSLQVRRVLENPGGSFTSGFFVQALDDERALVSSSDGLLMLDFKQGEILARAPLPNAWHFAISPDGNTVALTRNFIGAGDSLHLLTLPDLSQLRAIRLPLQVATHVAFDPDGELYVMGRDLEENWHFLVIDPLTEEIARDVELGNSSCGGSALPTRSPSRQAAGTSPSSSIPDRSSSTPSSTYPSIASRWAAAWPLPRLRTSSLYSGAMASSARSRSRSRDD